MKNQTENLRNNKVKYIASCSGGKDSVATIILAHEHNEPLDEIIFAEVMFDENISGELPEHIDFIKNKLKPLCESWGYKFTILHSNKTYLDCFFAKRKRSRDKERIGRLSGFPMQLKCILNKECKVKPIIDFKKKLKNYIDYIGIAIDEPERLERLHNRKNQISLLEKYNFTEKDAYNLCQKYNLLSPIYIYQTRGGCWFCPNQKNNQLKYLRKNHNNLWKKLLELEKTENIIGKYFRGFNKEKLSDLDRKFKYDEEHQLFEYN